MKRGVTILEVLIAMLVTTVGLLGALAVIPVASTYARKGKLADSTAISGTSAIHQFDTRAMRRPETWMGWNPSASPPQFTLVPLPAGNLPVQGVSWCIDPRFVSLNSANGAAASIFPYVPTTFANEPRMTRITLTDRPRLPENSNSANPPPVLMSALQANSIFVFPDDLAFDRPDDNSMPAQGGFVLVDHDNDGPTGTPGIPRARQTGGHMSWFATLVPKLELYAGSALVQNDSYLLSVVVLNDRPMVNLAIDGPGSDLYQFGERVVGVDWAEAGGLGYAGGEVFLTWGIAQSPANDVLAKDTVLKLRAGDWIMLSGNALHTVTNGAGVPLRMPVFRWYRVTECDAEPEYHAAESHYALAVSLDGQDWDTSLIDQQAAIVTGVVGVYEKSIRIER